ncbi:hypothetical protein PV327_011430, partial [Microctonus hyperodae]
VGLARNVRCIPHHLFDEHDGCGKWCKKKNNTSSDYYEQKFLIKYKILYDDLQLIFNSYADNAFKYCISASRQANEAFNHAVTRKFPKNKNISLSSSGFDKDYSHMTSPKIIDKNTMSIVFYDLETSRRNKNSDILQIAPIADKKIFS